MSIPIVYKDNNNHIWLGQSEGLTLWDLGKDTLYFCDKNKGLCDNVIRGILEDDFHNIWVTTSNGVSVISLDKEGIGSLKTTITNFSVKDGLIDNYFNNQAIYKLRNGNILVGVPRVTPLQIQTK
jgi:ligand-binding sensor domain-containing protein